MNAYLNYIFMLLQFHLFNSNKIHRCIMNVLIYLFACMIIYDDDTFIYIHSLLK